MGSILVIVAAIIWAYITDNLPEQCCNEFDRFILGRKPPKDVGRVQIFQRFILAMSDQQLVSGLALVIATKFIRYGVFKLDTKLSAYAYSNAVILAFFSCIIHPRHHSCPQRLSTRPRPCKAYKGSTHDLRLCSSSARPG
jgi:hypothetical protein